jgi:diguanylate cyclase (GGDEF)-like protein
MMFDTPTLHMVTVVIHLVMAVIYGQMARAHPQEPAIRIWVVGCLIAACGSLLLKLRGDLPDFWTIVLGNLFFIGGYAFLWAGFRLYLRAQPRWALIAAILFVQTALMFALTELWSDRWARITIGSLSIALFNLLLMRDLVRARRANALATFPLLIIVTGIAAAYYLGRAGIGVMGVISHPPVTLSDPIFTFSVIISLITFLVTNIGFVMLVSERLQQKLNRQAVTDDLTELLNRRAFTAEAQRELARAVRDDRPTALLLLDLDRFKSINDRYGHQAGDKVLQGFAATLAQCVRDGDIIGRTGGEEFAALLPNTDVDEALRVAQRVRQDVAALAITFAGSDIATTVSIGTTVVQPGETLDTALARADSALYAAKHGGRDRVDVRLFGSSEQDMLSVEWAPTT